MTKTTELEKNTIIVLEHAARVCFNYLPNYEELETLMLELIEVLNLCTSTERTINIQLCIDNSMKSLFKYYL